MTPYIAHHDLQPQLYTALRKFLTKSIWGEQRPMSPGTIIGVEHLGETVAAAMLHNYDPYAGVIEVSAASDDKRWLTRPVLWALFNEAFNVIGVQAVVARMDPKNESLCSIFSRYGFTGQLLPHMRGKGVPEMVMILGVDEWKANGFHKENEHG